MNASLLARMTLGILAVVALAAVVAAGTAGELSGSASPNEIVARQGIARSATRPTCVPDDARIVLARGQVAVYRHAGDIRICNQERDDVTIATIGEKIFSPPVLQIRGNLVAFATYLDDVEMDMESVEIRLIDLDDKNQDTILRRVEAGEIIKIASLRLTADGTVAWIDCTSDRYPPQLRNGKGAECYRSGRLALVYKAARAGNDPFLRATRLDQGRTIIPSSLRLNGRTLSWKKGSRRRTAHL